MKISTFFTALVFVAALFFANEATAQTATPPADKATTEMIQNYGLASDVAGEVRDYNREIAERVKSIIKATEGATDARNRKLSHYEDRYLAKMKDLLGKSTYGRVENDLKAYFKSFQK